MTGGDNEHSWGAGLQPERTSLAWRRLALALLALALAIPNLAWLVLGIWTLVPASVVAAGAITLVAASHRQYLSTHHFLTAGTVRPLPDGRLIGAAALSAMILATVAVAIVAAQVT